MLPRLHQGRCQTDKAGSRRSFIQKLRRWRAVACSALAMSALLSGFTGCTSLNNARKAVSNSAAWNDTVLGLRNRSFSAKAWHRRKHHYCNQRHSKDFCAGFRAAYEDVAGGSDGCTPAFPPKEYWNWEFQSAEGQARTAAWLAGYPHGARAAEEDGVANWNQLQMSPALQAQYQQEGMFTHQGALYPIPTEEQTQAGYPEEMPMIDLPPGAELLPVDPNAPVPGIEIPVAPGT